MLNSIIEQKAATKNQITAEKPTVDSSVNLLQGYIANSMNGGFLKPIAYKKVMAGEKIYEYRLDGRIRLLVPKVPAAQKLKAVLYTFFVPNSRVWKNAEKYTAQKGGSTEIKIKEIPNFGGIELPQLATESETLNPIITDTTSWRDSWISTYIPRYQTGVNSPSIFRKLPKTSILPARGFVAIYNDMLRNKEYDEPLQEFNEDTVTGTETSTYFPTNASINKKEFIKEWNRTHIRGKRQNSYYTDYRTEIVGENFIGPDDALNDLMGVNEWVKKIAEARSQAENAQLNDWDIIAKIRGSKPLTEGKVTLLSEKVIGLNYTQVTQTAYNVNQEITEEYQQLGVQGAYSYTEFNIPLFTYKEFKEEGYIHVIMQVTADSVFETGFDRNELNVTWDSEYRPDLKELKQDVLYDIEKRGTRITSEEDLTKVTGFKRKYSEYFKLPNIISGDMTTKRWNQTKITDGDTSYWAKSTDTEIDTHREFTFFEFSDREDRTYNFKKIWKDYTDLLINKNQAIMQEEIYLSDKTAEETETDFATYVNGQNQIFIMGIMNCLTDQPIDENIKNNFTKWGER